MPFSLAESQQVSFIVRYRQTALSLPNRVGTEIWKVQSTRGGGDLELGDGDGDDDDGSGSEMSLTTYIGQ